MLLNSLATSFISTGCGMPILLSFGIDIFARTSSILPPVQSALIVALISFVMSIFTTSIMDRLKHHKCVLIMSLIGTAIGFFTLSYELLGTQNPSAQCIQFTALIFTILCVCAGISPSIATFRLDLLLSEQVS